MNPAAARPGSQDEERGGGLVLPFRGHAPVLGAGVFLAPHSVAIGRVTMGDRASLWFNSVARGDIAPITIGEDSNIQDNSVLHVGDEFPLVIGSRVVVGHRAILHGCVIGDEVMIGMGATVMNGAVIGPRSVVAAGALVTEGTVVPEGSVVMGAPGKVVRPATPKQVETTIHLAHKYARVAGEYLDLLGRR